MVLTVALKMMAFFEGEERGQGQNQIMGIPHNTVLQLQTKGILSVTDLADFDSTGCWVGWGVFVGEEFLIQIQVPLQE